MNEGSNKIGTLELECLLRDALFLKNSLVRHIPGSPLGDDKVLLLGRLENTIAQARTNEAANLAVHGLGPESRRAEVDGSVLGDLAFDGFGSLGSPFEDLELQSGVLLREDSLAYGMSICCLLSRHGQKPTFTPIVVHAWLAILDGVDSVAAVGLVELESEESAWFAW